MSVYFSDVTLFDGRTVKTKQGVLVSDGAVAWSGAHVRAPRAARAAHEEPGAGRTLSPGLIDVHVHLQFDGEADFAAEGRELTPGLAALKAAANLRRHLEHGVTTVRDLGGLGGVSCDVGRAVERGLIPGPQVVAAGRALTITGGHGHNVGFAREVDGADEIRKAVREEIKTGATAIKVVATGGVLTPGIGATFTAFTPEELEAAVDEAHTWGRRVAAHAIGAEGILASVRAGADSVEHCAFMTTQIAKEMRARGTYRSPTICALRGMLDHEDEVPAYAVGKAREVEVAARAAQRLALREGVLHVCGTDAGTPFNPHGNAPRELTYMVAWGMTPLKAMQAGTANGAALLGLEGIGVVEAGARADLVLYDGNPVEDIEHVRSPRLVLRAGEPAAGELSGP